MSTPPAPHLAPTVFADLPGVVAGFSTRAGGVSPAPYAALNLGLSTDDADANVRENRRRLFEGLGFGPDALAIAGQVHGAEVEVVDRGGLYRGTDGLATRTPGVLLCISAADCAAVLLADAEAGVVAACHSGWRGTVANIAARTVERAAALGAEPARLRAYVSPCISAEHFEVGEEVAAHFDDAFVRRPEGAPRPFVDLKGAIAAQLRAAGVRPAHVEVDPHCTVARRDRFFSYRAEDGRTGRMMGFVGLVEGR